MKCIRIIVAMAGSVLVLAGSTTGQAAPPGPPVQQAYIKAAFPDQYDFFGTALAASGNTIVVTAPGEASASPGVNGDQTDESAVFSGAAFVFVQEPTGWVQQAFLKTAAPAAHERFGTSVAIDGDTLVVGLADDTTGAQIGSAHVFVREGSTWSEQAVLTASNAGALDEFGTAVAISGDTIVVGAPHEDSPAVGVNGGQGDGASAAGAAYVFVRSGTSWSQQAYIKASNTAAGHHFGGFLALDGETLVVGADRERSGATGVNGNQADNSAANSGAAYVFVRSGTTWSQQAYLKASNTDAGDLFGGNVSVSGDLVAVGAMGEESGASGINGNQADNGITGAGAVYVFVRSGTSWSQQAYIKASNPGVLHHFSRVSADGEMLLVGAERESSGACGVGGSQAAALLQAGAAYLFQRSSGVWRQVAYIKPSYTSATQRFGWDVALSGELCAVASKDEDCTSGGINGDQTALVITNKSGAAYAFDLDPAPWTDLTFGLAGITGVPTLAGDGPLTAGSANTLMLAGGPPLAPVMLVAGTPQLVLPFKQGTLVPPPTVLLPLTTDASGSVNLPLHWPAAIPVGSALYLQCWLEDAAGPFGFSASNALEAVAH